MLVSFEHLVMQFMRGMHSYIEDSGQYSEVEDLERQYTNCCYCKQVKREPKLAMFFGFNLLQDDNIQMFSLCIH